MSVSSKLTKAQRENIIFKFLKTGEQDPLYEVQQTKYGKYFVKPKPIELEEEETKEPEPSEEQEEEQEEEEEEEEEEEPIKRRKAKLKRNSRAKQDAKRILEALTNIISSNNDDSSDEYYDRPRAPQLIEQPNIRNNQLSFRRNRLRFN